MNHFLPPPPTFIGGRQPYAPRLGLSPAALSITPDNPPGPAPIAIWIPSPPFPTQQQLRRAPIVQGAPVPDAPPPTSTARFNGQLAHIFRPPPGPDFAQSYFLPDTVIPQSGPAPSAPVPHNNQPTRIMMAILAHHAAAANLAAQPQQRRNFVLPGTGVPPATGPAFTQTRISIAIGIGL